MRLPVSAKEVRETEDVPVLVVADDDRAYPDFDEPNPAKDERAHDALAEIGLGDEQRAELFRRNDESLDGLVRIRIDERRSSRELREFAEEVPRLVRDDQLAPAELVVPADGDLTGENHDLPVSDLSHLHERL